MANIKNIALINDKDQVVNHIVIDLEDTDAIEVMHREWGTVRYVETTDTDVIILDPRPTVWTTHSEGVFVLPEQVMTPAIVTFSVSGEPPVPVEQITINGRVYPKDSMLIKENASRRYEGWTFPDGEVEVSLSDAD